MTDHRIFEVEGFQLQSGVTLPRTHLAYATYGEPDAERANVVVYPTRYSGRHEDNEFLIGAGMALDPGRYFILVPNLLGNGVSSSPSNTPDPFGRAAFPHVTVLDNVLLQRRLLAEELGVERIALAVGWSMGAQQAYHWAALFPELVERLAPIGGSARTSRHNYVFLEGMKAALTADAAWKDGWYETPPTVGLKAMGRAWAGWALSQQWYREAGYQEMGYASLEDFLSDYWEPLFLSRDANNLLALLRTWQHADISANDVYGGDFERALGAITAKTIVMPGETDLYFPPEDSAYEVAHMSSAELRPIPSVWGHYAGGGRDPAATRFIDLALKELLEA